MGCFIEAARLKAPLTPLKVKPSSLHMGKLSSWSNVGGYLMRLKQIILVCWHCFRSVFEFALVGLSGCDFRDGIGRYCGPQF